jgi:predicted enzyme related to lactoylglutathione lyase
MRFTYDHLHLHTLDVPGTIEFYKSNLEAEIVDLKRPAGGATINIGGARIAISPLMAGQSFDSKVIGDRPLDHFAFTVPDLDTAAKRLKDNGVAFFAEPKEIRPGVKIAYVLAPDNVKIELIQRG